MTHAEEKIEMNNEIPGINKSMKNENREIAKDLFHGNQRCTKSKLPWWADQPDELHSRLTYTH